MYLNAHCCIVVYAHDTKRYHPYIFAEAPMPGPYDSAATATRAKSRGHHTSGFATYEKLAEAVPAWLAHGRERFGDIPYDCEHIGEAETCEAQVMIVDPLFFTNPGEYFRRQGARSGPFDPAHSSLLASAGDDAHAA